MPKETASTNSFGFSMNEDGGIVVIDAKGPVNSRYSPMLRDAILKAFQSEYNKVVLKVDDINYMDSSGLATLVEGMQLADTHGGKFALAGTIDEKIVHLFQITRLDDLFVSYPSIDAAKEALA